MNETLRVLLVEDDEDYCLLIRDLLAGSVQGRFELEWVTTYEAGLAEIRQDRHDVYVLDHRLGQRTGLELLRSAIEGGCAAPVIILTGAANPETAVAAMKSGAADYLVKGSIDTQLLQRTLRYAVRARWAAEEKREAEGRFRAAFEDAPIGMALVDLSGERTGRLLDVNPALCGIVGRAEDELLESSLLTLFDAAGESDRVRGLLEGRCAEGENEFRLLRSTGERGWVSLHVSILTRASGSPTQAIAQIVDITERKEHETYLKHLAGEDPLTGLLNRRRFRARLEECLGRSARYDDSGAVLLLDLDGFRELKREHGEDAAEDLLKVVADVLRQRIRSTDVLAKLGGAEFAAVLMEADQDAARSVGCELVEAVRTAIGDAPRVELPEVSLNVGIASFGAGNPLEAEDLLAAAYRALCRAKGIGPAAVASIDDIWVTDSV